MTGMVAAARDSKSELAWAECVPCAAVGGVWGVAAERRRGHDYVQGRRTETWKKGCGL